MSTSASFVQVNAADMNPLSALCGGSAVGFGLISDHLGRIARSYAAAGVFCLGIGLVLGTLPKDPPPHDDRASS
ncbi:MAG: hypothetical protein ACKV0T_17600 [Planctomycetales bacterium]